MSVQDLPITDIDLSSVINSRYFWINDTLFLRFSGFLDLLSSIFVSPSKREKTILDLLFLLFVLWLLALHDLVVISQFIWEAVFKREDLVVFEHDRF